MTEKIASPYIEENQSFLDNQIDLRNQFQTEFYDPQVQELNTLALEKEGLYRSKQIIAEISSHIMFIINMYKEYSKDQLEPGELQDELSRFRDEWCNRIGIKMLEEAVYSSGTAGQYIQMIKGLGILPYDAMTVTQSFEKRLTSRIHSLLKKLSEYGIEQSDLLITNEDLSNPVLVLQKLVDLEQRLIQIDTILSKKKQKNENYTLNEQEKKLVALEQLLHSNLEYIFKQYADSIVHIPKRFASFSLLKQLENEENQVSKQLEKIEIKYQTLSEAAKSAGYTYDSSWNIFRKKTATR